MWLSCRRGRCRWFQWEGSGTLDPFPPRPHGLTAPPEQEKIDPGCRDLPDHINEGIDGYVFSGDVTDLALQAQGFTELVVRPLTDFDFDVFWDIFLRMSADLSLPLPD